MSEIGNGNENGRKRREWVKTAAIIFLSVMLLLTFFSNTIMNYSLPEVATQYVQSGTITAKIRGSGTVENNGEPYNVLATETRKVAQVAVKVGDEVEKDAVLMLLEDEESAELKEARTELENLRMEYDRKLVAADMTVGIVNKVESGNATSAASKLAQIDAYNQQIDALEKVIKDYNSRAAEIEAELNKLKEETVDTSEEKQAVKSAERELAKIENWIGTAKEQLDMAQQVLEKIGDRKKEPEEKVAACQKKADEAREKYVALSKRKEELEAMLRATPEPTLTPEPTPEPTATPEPSPGTTSAPTSTPEVTPVAPPQEMLTEEEKKELASLSASISAAYNEMMAADAELKSAQKTLSDVTASETTVRANAVKAVGVAQVEYNTAIAAKKTWEEKLADAQSSLEDKQEIKPDTSHRDALNDEKVDLGLSIAKATAEKTDAEKALEELLAGFTKEADLAELLIKIRRQKELVAELTAKSVGAAIKAPVAGKVTALNRAAGESTSPSEAVAVLQPAGKGFTMSFSVTNEQAKRLSVGDVADLVNAWRYDSLEVKLASIKPDTKDPGRQKLLIFDVVGDVTPGQTLNVSVGQKSANYDLIVPNSAVREDNNGKFILIVESRQGPLNTRYIATRVDVEVLASDDTQTAVSGALYGYEFVITTSTKPVEAGKQVRLAEGSA